MPEIPPIRYRVDARNSLVSVNDAWVAEAQEALDPGLASPEILGREIWQLISDPSLQHLFDRLFRRLRAGEIPRVNYLFRCDTPDLRRLHRLTITADASGSLHFKSAVVALKRRPRIQLLDPAIRRSPEILRICGWCKRIPLPDQRWVEIEDALGQLDALDRAPAPLLSHGICPDCERTMDSLLQRPSATGPDTVTFGEWP